MRSREGHGPPPPTSEPLEKGAAQRRVDQIHAFRRELEELERAGALGLTVEQRARLDEHIGRTLADLADRFDIDISDSQKRLSLGMRILSALGGIAFCMALVLFFYRFWGDLTTPVQVLLLVVTPLLLMAVTEWISSRDKTRYYTALLGVVACAAFALNLGVIGSTFNIRPTPLALLGWGAFALTIAYTYGLRLPLAAGLVSLAVFAAGAVMSQTGEYWGELPERPEYFIVLGALTAAAPLVVRHRRQVAFPVVYRLIGLLLAFFALEILMHESRMSYIPLSTGSLKAVYQVIAFAGAGLVVWLGIRGNKTDLVNLGSAVFAVYLFDRLFSWWWDWMPRYLFFLIIGLMALFLLLVFRRLRARAAERRLA